MGKGRRRVTSTPIQSILGVSQTQGTSVLSSLLTRQHLSSTFHVPGIRWWAKLDWVLALRELIVFGERQETVEIHSSLGSWGRGCPSEG